MKQYLLLLAMIAFIAVVSGCNPYNKAGEGAVTGGLLGTMAGGIIGHQTHSTATGMLIGGAVGAASGAVIGSQVPKPVPPPATAVVTQPAVPTTVYSGDTVTINVPNNSGGYTAVVLKKSGNGFIGPQGEYYTEVPSTEQLRVMYGR